MPLIKKIHYTAEDYWNLSENERAELINGTLYNMTPPSRMHQKLVPIIYTFVQKIPVGIYDGLEIQISELLKDF